MASPASGALISGALSSSISHITSFQATSYDISLIAAFEQVCILNASSIPTWPVLVTHQPAPSIYKNTQATTSDAAYYKMICEAPCLVDTPIHKNSTFLKLSSSPSPTPLHFNNCSLHSCAPTPCLHILSIPHLLCISFLYS